MGAPLKGAVLFITGILNRRGEVLYRHMKKIGLYMQA